jgi:hypothetical protein
VKRDEFQTGPKFVQYHVNRVLDTQNCVALSNYQVCNFQFSSQGGGWIRHINRQTDKLPPVPPPQKKFFKNTTKKWIEKIYIHVDNIALTTALS